MYYSTQKSNIIIVSPNEFLRNSLRTMLETKLKEKSVIYIEQDEAVAAINLISGLSKAQEPIAIIICDQELKGINGTLFFEKIKPLCPDAQKILLIDQLDFEMINHAIEVAEIYRYLQKPCEPNDFLLTIEAAFVAFYQKFELSEKNRILNEIHRASMSLIGEINLKKLLHKLMRIVIDNAHAEIGYLILPYTESAEKFYVAAMAEAHSFETNFKEIVIDENSVVPQVIINYAVKSLDNIILQDAMHEGMFSMHPQIKKRALRSILCSPLVYQGKLMGVLYLENNQTISAFSPYTMELFRLLSAPAAIAIQNATLYNQLEIKVEERTREVILQKHQIEKQLEEIEERNRDVLNSINYARRIQDAFIPPISEIAQHFQQSFVFFKPKDIVSGDFFWFSQRLSKIIIAAVDCTGHGIPGAFMSVMANTILKQIVEVEGIFKPDKILELLHMRIRIALQQDATQSKEGMDVAICQIDTKRKRLNFAGANRPLVLIRNGELLEVKPDKYPVGGDQTDEIRYYTDHTIDLEENDTLYLFSDGFADQNNEYFKKYQSKKLYQFFLDHQHETMERQCDLLEGELLNWKGDMEQTDDILVIGARM